MEGEVGMKAPPASIFGDAKSETILLQGKVFLLSQLPRREAGGRGIIWYPGWVWPAIFWRVVEWYYGNVSIAPVLVYKYSHFLPLAILVH